MSFFEEVRLGPQSAVEMKRICQAGEFVLSGEAFTDSGSLFSHLEADHLKFPSDKGTFFHLAYIRELLRTRVSKAYYRIDTRDMCVDGLTKGKLDRFSLHELMSGRWKLAHASKTLHADNMQAIASQIPAGAMQISAELHKLTAPQTGTYRDLLARPNARLRMAMGITM
eukprot:1094153-Pyramimonas_sp.AAC.2